MPFLSPCLALPLPSPTALAQSQTAPAQPQTAPAVLTGQLCRDGLEGQLSELLYERPQQRAAHQLMLAVVQLVHRHQPVGQHALHQDPVPAGGNNGRISIDYNYS